jgi:hypothetical protein
VLAACAVFGLGSAGYNLWFWFGPRSWHPRLTCERRVFDFGERQSGETVEHTFRVENTGRADVEISRLRSSCGCLTAELPRRRLAPGEAMSVPAQIALKGLRGRVMKTIVIKSNDPHQPALVLALTGSVRDGGGER